MSKGHRGAGILALCAVSIAIAACGGSDSGGVSDEGPVRAAVFQPFSGADAGFGPTLLSGCLSAQASINEAGGVLGREFDCVTEDTGTNPNEAVPAANRMLSSVENLALVIGPSNSGPATTPIISEAGVAIFSTSGDPHYNNNTDPNIFRLTPSDDLNGTVMAYWGKQNGFKRAAIVFEDSAAAETNLASLQQTFEQLGGEIVTELKLVPEQSSYRTEAARLVDSGVDGVFTELDARTASTFWNEVLQQAGELPLMISDERQFSADWLKPFTKAIGVEPLKGKLLGVSPGSPEPGPALDEFQKGIKGLGSEIQDPEQYLEDPYSTAGYNAAIIAALAMTAADSADPTKFRSFVKEITGEPADGATKVSTFADGVRALKSGEKIAYISTAGPIVFDRFQNASGAFTTFEFVPSTLQTKPTDEVTAAEIARLRGE
ncbi:MAG TPA: ABC transporter substrate-binding protein [Gemmatimonadaceae bacterium]|nr:ABC transporter substrate-binding protein [Gemmatimonadaceae bacterium]